MCIRDSANGKYDFIITDNGGNTFTLHTEVSNIDYVAPEAEYSVTPDIWTNGPAAIHVTATDPKPEDGYADVYKRQKEYGVLFCPIKNNLWTTG